MMHAITLSRCSVLLAGLAMFGISTSAQAGAITPWSGASASANAFNQYDSQNGSTARASATGTGTWSYQNGYDINEGIFFTLHPYGSTKAEATGNPDSLLHIEANYYSTNPGTNPKNVQGASMCAHILRASSHQPRHQSEKRPRGWRRNRVRVLEQ